MVPGSVIAGRFTVVRTIARSAMALVVEATDERGQRVAVKLLERHGASGADSLARFEREGHLVASLKSPHVVRVFEVGAADGRPFIVMELLEGNTLAREVRLRKRIPLEEAMSFVAEACDALMEAHDAGIVHRDIKPQNMLLAKVGERRILKILDFGISKLMSAQITMTDALFGSPLYMAPEMFKSAKLADVRSDVWSLGVVLYEMLTGVAPFVSDTPVAVGLLVTREPYVPASWKCSDLPPAIDSVLARALAKSPNERYSSVRELLAAVAPFLPGGRHETLMTRAATNASHTDDDNPRTMAEAEIATRIVSTPRVESPPERLSLDGGDAPTRVVMADAGDAPTRIREQPPSFPPDAGVGLRESETGPIANPVSVTAKEMKPARARTWPFVVVVAGALLCGAGGYVIGHRPDSSAHATTSKTDPPPTTTPSGAPHSASDDAKAATPAPSASPSPTQATDVLAVPTNTASATASASASAPHAPPPATVPHVPNTHKSNRYEPVIP